MSEPTKTELDAARERFNSQRKTSEPDYADDLASVNEAMHERAEARAKSSGHRHPKSNGTEHIELWTPQPIEIEQLMREPPPRPAFMIDGLLPPGLVFLAGRPKQGKSLLALGMALGIATGLPFWGREVRKGRVLYLDLESSGWRVYERVTKTGIDVPTGLTFFFEWRRGNRQALIDLLDERPDVRMVVIDIWRKFSLPLPRSVDPYEHEQSELSWLSKLGNERGISVLCVGHTVKNPSTDNDVFAGVGGSSAITGNADAVMLLRREGEDERVLYLQGRDLGEASYRLLLDSRLTFRCMGDASLSVSRSELRYLEAIRDGAITPSRLSHDIGVSRSAVSQMLQNLHANGLVSKRDGVLILTRIASQLLEAQADQEQAYREASGG